MRLEIHDEHKYKLQRAHWTVARHDNSTQQKRMSRLSRCGDDGEIRAEMGEKNSMSQNRLKEGVQLSREHGLN